MDWLSNLFDNGLRVTWGAGGAQVSQANNQPIPGAYPTANSISLTAVVIIGIVLFFFFKRSK